MFHKDVVIGCSESLRVKWSIKGSVYVLVHWGKELNEPFPEMMIDHLNIESSIHHVDSPEAQQQIMEERRKLASSAECCE